MLSSFAKKTVCLMAFVALIVLDPWPRRLLAQIVTIANVSYPGTGLEVGDTVGVTIADAAPNGTVTVVTNGSPPYFYGYTDGNSNWSIRLMGRISCVHIRTVMSQVWRYRCTCANGGNYVNLTGSIYASQSVTQQGGSWVYTITKPNIAPASSSTLQHQHPRC